MATEAEIKLNTSELPWQFYMYRYMYSVHVHDMFVLQVHFISGR